MTLKICVVCAVIVAMLCTTYLIALVCNHTFGPVKVAEEIVTSSGWFSSETRTRTVYEKNNDDRDLYVEEKTYSRLN